MTLSSLGLLAAVPWLSHPATPGFFAARSDLAPARAVWIHWSDEAYLAGPPTLPVVVDAIAALAPHVGVRIVVDHARQIREAERVLERREVPRDRYRFAVVPGADRWLRDVGPQFLVGADGRRRIADFRYTMYGQIDPANPWAVRVEGMDRAVARLLGYRTIASRLVSEGGNHEIGPDGTLMAVEGIELQRNPGWTREAIADELRRVLGVRQVLWIPGEPLAMRKSSAGILPDGTYPSSVTGGHADEFVRFGDGGTVLLAQVPAEERRRCPVAARTHECLERARAAIEADGRYRIVRVPTPAPIFARYDTDPAEAWQVRQFGGAVPGQSIRYRLTTSYLNFVVANGAVLLPQYGTERDVIAEAAFARAFPRRRVVPIDVTAVNHGGGGLHCLTQNEPE